MKIIVLGGSGQIGSILCHGLRQHHDVVGTSRKPNNGCVRFDPFRNEWSALGKVDVLINCIGQIDATGMSSFNRIHVGLTELIIRNRALLGNPRIIQISALGASVNHATEFLRTKGIADDLLLQHPNTAVVRPSIICTPGTMIVRKMRMLSRISRYTMGHILLPKGFLETRIQPVMPADFVDIVAALCTAGNQGITNVVGPQPITLRDLTRLALQNNPEKLRLVEVPKPIVDGAISMITRIAPAIINAQQYRLLFEDNTADVNDCQLLLHRTMDPTSTYFRKEFNHATN